MKKEVILVGVGEMGGVFARAFLRSGHPVYPVEQGMELSDVADTVKDPWAVIVAVGEKDLHGVLDTVPKKWHDRVILLQNELLPRDWQAHRIKDPTVISVWFEKKIGQDPKVLVPSIVFGPHALLVKEALGTLNIPCDIVKNADALCFELVVKNLYILTVNISGLEVGGTVGELWEKHRELAQAVANDVMDIQFRLIGRTLERKNLIAGMVKAFQGDWAHKCMGRTAPDRLQRAIEQADQFGLEVKKLREIDQRQNKTAKSS